MANVLNQNEKNINESFPVADGGLLTLVTTTGALNIEQHDNTTVDVLVHIKGTDASELPDSVVTFASSQDNVDVTGTMSTTSGLTVTYTVKVPSVYNLNLSTGGGDITVGTITSAFTGDVTVTKGVKVTINDVTGTVSVDSEGGPVNIGDVTKDVTVTAIGGPTTVGQVGGSVTVTNGGTTTVGQVGGSVTVIDGGVTTLGKVSGSVAITSEGGTIQVDGVADYISAVSNGGNVTATFTQQPGGDSEIDIEGGNVIVYLPADIKVDLCAHTDGGNVSNDFTLDGTVSCVFTGGTTISGQINGGGPNLKLYTKGGNIEVNMQSDPLVGS